MNFDNVFSKFSRRPKPPGERKRLTTEFKTRVLMLCTEIHYPGNYNVLSSPSVFWSEVHRKLRFSMGLVSLSDTFWNLHFEDIERFLGECSDDHFLEFIEFVFEVQMDPEVSDARTMVSPTDINTFFNESELPYRLTDYQWDFQETVTGRSMRRSLVSLPQIVIRDSEVLHQMAIEPTLNLLRGQRWQSANEEYLKALQHFRKSEFGDCAAMCNSSLESVLKIICKTKGWENNPDNLVASRLLNIVIDNSNLEPYYKKILELVPVIRNIESPVHGGGSTPKVVPQHVAQFVVNMTASAILLLVSETSP